MEMIRCGNLLPIIISTSFVSRRVWMLLLIPATLGQMQGTCRTDHEREKIFYTLLLHQKVINYCNTLLMQNVTINTMERILIKNG